MRRITLISFLLTAVVLTGCDLLGESAEQIAANKEAEGKAIGGACRHAGRAIEDCYAMNRKADKASVFAGWRDMNDYMRENKIEAVPPQSLAVKAEPRQAEPKPAEPRLDTRVAPEPVQIDGLERRPPKTGAGGKVREPKTYE
jgi:hypothetical protein